jgi:hypothetical protein
MKTRSVLFAALMVSLAPDFYDQQKTEKEALKPQAQRLQVSSERSLKDVLFPDYSVEDTDGLKSPKAKKA